MTFIRTFLRRYESNVETSYRTCNTINATIRREGSRMVDNAEITISSKTDIRIKDYLGYIQDDIDLDGIMGLWNFAGSVRDESGNQLNEENAYNNFVVKSYLDYPDQSSSSQVLGKRSMELQTTSSGRYLKIPDKKVKTSSGSDSTTSIVDFSQDFTLAFYVKIQNITSGDSDSDRNRVIFDKYDDSTNKGIMVYIQTPQGSADSVQNLKVRIGNGSSNTIYTHNMTNTDWNNLDKHICVTRTNNVLKVYVENTEVISQTFTGDATSTADIYLGKEYSETASAFVEPSNTSQSGGMKGTYHQMRLYSRAWSTSEISTWVGLNAPTISLKFYGRIWRIDERNASNKCYLKGLGGVVLNSRIDSSVLTGDVSNLRDKNVYQSGADYTDIVQDMLKTTNEKFFGTSNSDIMMICYNNEQKVSGEGYTLRAPFIAEGSFLDILNDLSVLDESTFTFMPTGILQVEENDSLLTRGGLILSNNNCKINDGGIDDSNICNHLFVCGNLKIFNNKVSNLSRNHATTNSWANSFGRFSSNTSNGFPDVFPQAIVKVLQDSTEIPETSTPPTGTPSQTSYYVDYNTGLIYFYSTTSGTKTYTYEYSYNMASAEINNLNGGSSTGSISKIESDSGSITKNGLYAKKLSVPRITPNISGGIQDIDNFAEHFVDANKGDSNNNIQNRYEVKTPSFIGHIIENNKIGIYNLTKGIGSLVSGNIQPEYLQIKSIEYRYPDSQTKLEVGEFLYDSFDLENSLVEDVRSTQSNQF
jgi:hypothetical protein